MTAGLQKFRQLFNPSYTKVGSSKEGRVKRGIRVLGGNDEAVTNLHKFMRNRGFMTNGYGPDEMDLVFIFSDRLDNYRKPAYRPSFLQEFPNAYIVAVFGSKEQMREIESVILMQLGIQESIVYCGFDYTGINRVIKNAGY
ncbi:MAG: hypothetical protein UU77_C0051G0002 [candidate division WWE3 bacterium GW2011_GWC1_41_7]|uniref:Uncharacterized protein n=2 Tax=Katanobacteria TaxID=422282 RepID=A0A0G0X309_UNCKA|nr:MAG: hypothetical protein UU77_C0051G0002 [candidate division WWE3 bacterium GW2011_GWC1_41_7]OGC56782.1 MAG: hypothetical protein A2976_01440 [candidate division WWE3 bacterium RIFCSPLOWO2_01_FULL_41_9]